MVEEGNGEWSVSPPTNLQLPLTGDALSVLSLQFKVDMMTVGKETRRISEGVEAGRVGEEGKRTGGEGVEVVGGQELEEEEVECILRAVLRMM